MLRVLIYEIAPMKGKEVSKVELSEMLLKYGFDKVLVDIEGFIQLESVSINSTRSAMVSLDPNSITIYTEFRTGVKPILTCVLSDMYFTNIEDLNSLLQRNYWLRLYFDKANGITEANCQKAIKAGEVVFFKGNPIG